MTEQTGLGPWGAELARDGVVRIEPRRRVAAVRMLLFALPWLNAVGSIVSAALGRQSWLWFPLFSLIFVPAFSVLVWIQARMCLFGRPVLVVDAVGVSLGGKRLVWNDIQTIEGPNTRLHRPVDPRLPVDALREWFEFLTIAPATQRRRRQITVGRDHVKDLEALATWLDALRSDQQTSGHASEKDRPGADPVREDGWASG